MKNTTLVLGLIVSSLLAGCGGGGGTSPIPGSSLTTTTTTTTTDALRTASINGSAAYVTTANMPVYTFGGDTAASQSACTGSCLATWPAVAPPGGALTAPWASFTRSDTSTLQLTINGHALYTFVSDQPLVANGDNVENFHIARPPASTSTGTGGSGGGTGPYP